MTRSNYPQRTEPTENATFFDVDDAPPDKQEKFRRFSAYNTGKWNGPRRENKEVVYRSDNLYRFDCIASSVELTEFQKRRGRDVFDSLDFQEIGKPIDQIIFAVCVVVANAAVRSGTRYWPHSDSKNEDDPFGVVADELDLTLSQQLSVVQRVRARVDF